MSEWQKTSCVLCFNNCGLEVITEGSKIVKVRGEKENPRSQGYLCRKGANIAYFQNNPERLMFPLKRVRDRFERISWDQALDVILENKGLGMQKEGNIVQIRPKTKMKSLDDEAVEMRLTEEKKMPLSTVIFDINFATLSEIETQFKNLKMFDK